VSLVTSAGTAEAWPPAFDDLVGELGQPVRARADATTWKPSAAKRRADAAPIPLDAPVTTAMAGGFMRSILPNAGRETLRHLSHIGRGNDGGAREDPGWPDG